MLSKIKEYLLGLWALVTAGFALMFFYERNKALTNGAEADETKLKVDLAVMDQKILSNDEQLKEEEKKRGDLEKEQANASPDDILKYFNNK